MSEPEYEIGIYGHSDDLIEIVGDVEDEISANYGKPTYLGVGHSEVVVEYDENGIWRVEIGVCGPGDECYHHEVGGKTLVAETNEYTEGVVVKTNTAEVEKI